MAVIGGSSFVKDKAISKIVYLRLLSGGRRVRLHIPLRSGVEAAAVFTAPFALVLEPAV